MQPPPGFSFLAIASLVLLQAGRVDRARPVVWQAVAEGIERAQLEAFGKPVHAFRVDLERARLRLLAAGTPGERRPVAAIAAPFPEAVAVNASFFTDRDLAIGAQVDEGSIVSRRVVKSWGALVVAGRRARIVLGSDLKLSESAGGAAAESPTLVVQGIPRLLVGGQVMKLKAQTATRTAVCAAERHVTLVVTAELEATVLAQLLRAQLGCVDALNLDGGPSTQLHVRLGKLALSVEGGWGVPNALVAIPGR